MKPESLQNENPDRLRGGAVKRKKQHEVELPDLDIFKKMPGVEYFDPREWSSFPYGVGKGAKL